MDKNQVNIDELFRNKLSGAEEREKDGAWLNMRDLLDKNMPREKPLGFGFNKAALYGGFVLLLSAVGIGAWKMNPGLMHGFEQVAKSGTGTATPTKGADATEGMAETTTTPANTTGATVANNRNRTEKQVVASHEKVVAATTAMNVPATGDKKILTTLTSEKSATGTAQHAATDNGVATAKGHETAVTTATGTTGRATSPVTAQKAANENRIAAIHDQKTINTYAAAVPVGKPAKNDIRKSGHTTDNAVVARTEKNKHSKTQPAANNVMPAVVAAKQDEAQSRRIVKVVLNQRLVRDEKSGWYFTYDTVSQEMLVEQLNSINQLVNQEALETTDSKERALASAGSLKDLPGGALKTNGSADGAPSINSVKINPATEQKSEKSAGAKLIDNLASAFNDIRSTSSNVQFAPGLTGGINGTFFGPTSFYGFDFGLSGSFNFGEKFTVKTELKYFHRINSSYQLNDDYYAYEANPGGGYRKTKIDYDFSFSTLHSFELPVTVKYNVANFSCFAGGNFLYTFGINTSAAPLQDPSAPVQVVNTKSNDDQPTLSYKDFGQRFGMGYIFGIAFRLDPRSELDLRTVQTVWDNVRNDGAKTVSNTLYKSPSIQLSLNYRLGGKSKRDRNK